VRVELEPRVDHFRVENRAITSNRRRRLIIARRDGTDTIVVSGSVRLRSGPTEIWVAVHDPVAYFAAAVRAVLAQEGIVLRGGHRHVSGQPAGAWRQVYAHESGLPETLAITNKHSQNLYAESLAKLLGFRLGGRGDWRTAVDSVSRFAADLGVDATAFRLADGSGLSRANRATPRAVTTLLEQMYFHPYGRDFLLSLPFSGETDNAWEERLARSPYRGNVFAKTGTLRGVSTLSGYVKSASGRIHAFSILMNRTRGPWASRKAQDRFLRTLVDLG
jgi:D-alanyl-D-alanine carboxypeptidase/D-alanyl-D-alanine-endopeptidase (penicillin-binding protein 4)